MTIFFRHIGNCCLRNGFFLSLLFFNLFIASNFYAQENDRLDLKYLSSKSSIVIPFELENDFIVVDVYLENIVPLRFIVDTGAEYSLVLDKDLVDLLDVSYRRKFDISGADMDSVLTAYLATGMNFRVANSMIAKNRSILVLKENYFKFERITGTNIHGILGGDFLSRFVVEFDYRSQRMFLHDPARHKVSKRYQRVKSTFARNRPFLRLPVSVDGNSTNERKLLLDTGAGLFLLLYTAENDSTDLPPRVIPTNIAEGLGGAIKGNVGRSKSVKIGKQEFGDVITYFQNSPFLRGDERIGKNRIRDGIIGNTLLRRFNLIIDYVQREVYLRPTRKWKKPVKYDRSGLQVAAGGRGLRTFLITDVLPGSPADEAGLKIGDRIKKLNGNPASILTLGGIFNRLEGKAGKRIRITVKRLDKTLGFEFRLRDLI